MGTYKRVVYEKVGDIPETKKGRKIQHDLDVLRTNVQTGKELLLFREESEKLYSPVRALNYLKKYKDLKEHKDLHNPSYIAAMQVCLRFFQCYDGPINGKWISTKLALKRFGKKYETKFGKVKGPYSVETLKTLEAAFKDNEKELDKLYHGYEDDTSEKSSSSEKNVSSKTSSQKQNSSSSSSSSSKSVSGSSSNSNSLSNNSSTPSQNKTSTPSNSSTSSAEKDKSQNPAQNQADAQTQAVEKKKEESQTVIEQSEQETLQQSSQPTESNESTPKDDEIQKDEAIKKSDSQPEKESESENNTGETSKKEPVIQNTPPKENNLNNQVNVKEGGENGEQSTSENPQSQKTPEELEKEKIEQGKEDLQTALNTIQNTLTNYQKKLTELQYKINGLQPTSTDSNEKSLVEEKKSSYLQREKELETTIQTLTQQQTTLSNQLSTLLSKPNITKEAIQTIKNPLTLLQPQVNTLVKDAKKLIDEVNSYEKDLTPEKPSGTVSQKIGEYCKKIANGEAICASYAFTAATELLMQQNKVLKGKEVSVWRMEKEPTIQSQFDIKRPTSALEIKNQILSAPRGSILTLRYGGTQVTQDISDGVTHAMVSLGGGKYTDFFNERSRTIDLNKIQVVQDPIYGHRIEIAGNVFYFVSGKGNNSAIMTPKESIQDGKKTLFDFDAMREVFSHNYQLSIGKKCYERDFSEGESKQKVQEFARKTGLDFDAIWNNFLVSSNGKYNIVLSKNVHLFAALIQKHTNQPFNFIRAKLYEKCGLDRTKGQTSVQGKSIFLPCNKKLETKQTTPVQPREQNEDLSYKEMSRNLKSNPSNYKNGDCEIEFTNDLKQNLNIAYNALKNGKQTIMKQFPKLTNKEYDEIAKKCLGILYKETKIGLDMETSTFIHSTTGISELSWNSAVGNQTYQNHTKIVNKLNAVGVQSIEDFNDIAKGTKGTMVVLIQRYYDLIKPRVKLGNRKNSQNELMTQDNCYEYLYYIWNNYQGRITGDVSKRIPPKELYACRVINRFINLSVQE